MLWFAVVSALTPVQRVHAADLLGDAGRSDPQGQPMRTVADAMNWLDGVLDQLDLPVVQLCGHSFGGWLALTYALHPPHRVDRLALLDPTSCFASWDPRYLLHGTPSLALPSPARASTFLRWEIAGLPVDEGWLRLATAAAGLPRSRLVTSRRPRRDDLRRLTTPTLLLLAEQSRCHNIHRVDTAARAALPRVTTAVIRGASHHSLPTGRPHDVSQHLLSFLTTS